MVEDSFHEGRDSWGGPGELDVSHKMKGAAVWGEGKIKGVPGNIEHIE